MAQENFGVFLIGETPLFVSQSKPPEGLRCGHEWSTLIFSFNQLYLILVDINLLHYCWKTAMAANKKQDLNFFQDDPTLSQEQPWAHQSTTREPIQLGCNSRGHFYQHYCSQVSVGSGQNHTYGKTFTFQQKTSQQSINFQSRERSFKVDKIEPQLQQFSGDLSSSTQMGPNNLQQARTNLTFRQDYRHQRMGLI